MFGKNKKCPECGSRMKDMGNYWKCTGIKDGENCGHVERK